MDSAKDWSFPYDDASDPTYYPTGDDMPDDIVQALAGSAFRDLLQRFLEERGLSVFVGLDQFFYYVQGNPRACVAPDVYVLPGVEIPQFQRIGSWKKWQRNPIPVFALEIMSLDNPEKDERKSPERHDDLGTNELLVFDPYCDMISGRTRFRLFCRDEGGNLRRVIITNLDRVYSPKLGCFVRAVGAGNTARLRIGTGPEGEELFPTADEVAEQATRVAREAVLRAEEEARRANEEARRAETEARRANDEARRANDEARRADEAEAELARLRALLAKRTT